MWVFKYARVTFFFSTCTTHTAKHKQPSSQVVKDASAAAKSPQTKKKPRPRPRPQTNQQSPPPLELEGHKKIPLLPKKNNKQTTPHPQETALQEVVEGHIYDLAVAYPLPKDIPQYQSQHTTTTVDNTPTAIYANTSESRERIDPLPTKQKSVPPPPTKQKALPPPPTKQKALPPPPTKQKAVPPQPPPRTWFPRETDRGGGGHMVHFGPRTNTTGPYEEVEEDSGWSSADTETTTTNL